MCLRERPRIHGFESEFLHRRFQRLLRARVSPQLQRYMGREQLVDVGDVRGAPLYRYARIVPSGPRGDSEADLGHQFSRVAKRLHYGQTALRRRIWAQALVSDDLSYLVWFDALHREQNLVDR